MSKEVSTRQKGGDENGIIGEKRADESCLKDSIPEEKSQAELLAAGDNLSAREKGRSVQVASKRKKDIRGGGFYY